MSIRDENKPLVSIFLIACLVLVALQMVPASPAFDAAIAPVKETIQYFGLWQRYKFFSPVLTDDLFLVAEVKFADGSTAAWRYPQLSQSSFMEKLILEAPGQSAALHIRRINSPRGLQLRPDMARFAARLYKDDPRRVVQVTLYEHVVPIKPPGTNSEPAKEASETTRILAVYQVKSGTIQ